MAKPEHKHIYNSARWQRLRLFKLRMNPLCEYCPAGRQWVATEVDHLKAISDGGAPFDLANMRSCCVHCHNQKTADGEALRGCGEDGLPRDARHWWY